MDSQCSDRDAAIYLNRYFEAGVTRDLALRVYISRLLGGDPGFVLNDGGNIAATLR